MNRIPNSGRRGPWAVALFLVCIFSAGPFVLAQARQYTFSPGDSRLEVHVPKAGLLSAMGHDHLIRALTFSGRVDFADGASAGNGLVLEVPVSALTVADPEVGEETRLKIESEMRGSDVLAGKPYPVIRFKADRITIDKSGKWRVSGFLHLRGRSRQIEFLAEVTYPRDGRMLAEGSLALEPEVFGIEPVAALGGMVRTADTVEIRFRITGILQPR